MIDKRLAGIDVSAAIATNVLILGVLAGAAVLSRSASDLYYASVQEDATLEWATFWAFFLAAAAGSVAGLRRRRAVGFPWLLFGVALFCFVVAMEEISWGQRILGYHPPTFFLEHNLQQELTFHDLFGSRPPRQALKCVILGYGIALPLLTLLPRTRRWLKHGTVAAPPAGLMPAFLVTYLTYEAYPWSHTGEWVEMALGLGFLFTAVAAVRELAPNTTPRWLARPLVAVAGSWLLVLGLGAASAALSGVTRNARPEALAAARTEVEALGRDFAHPDVDTRCNLHKRVHAFARKYRQDHLYDGELARLTGQGLPAERARYFLDPWGSPYWIRDLCGDDERRIVFVYSFGPNRRRDSNRWQILGDDVGTVVYQGRPEEEMEEEEMEEEEMEEEEVEEEEMEEEETEKEEEDSEQGDALAKETAAAG